MENKPEEPRSYITREVPGLIFVLLAVILFLALISFDPLDPSFMSYSTAETDARPVNNYIGPAGAHLAAGMVDFFGLSSFWFVLLFLVLAWRLFRGGSFNHPRLVAVGVFILLFDSAAAFSMIFPRIESFWQGAPGGGMLGDLLARLLVEGLNTVGASLVVAGTFIVALILATGLSLIRAASGLLIWTDRMRSSMEEERTKRHEKSERSKRLKEVLEKRKDRVEPAVKKKSPPPAPKPVPVQETFDFPDREGPYQIPPAELLDEFEKDQSGISQDSLLANARLVEKKLNDFNVTGEVVEVSTGPVITMYEYRPAPGVKISKVAGLADDLAMNMRAVSIRVVAPLPGKAAIGIEIPNHKREMVSLKEVATSPAFQESKSLLTIVLGVDIMGQPEVGDLQRMPHLLIAGATGSGKSVGLNAIIMSILLRAKPDEVRFLMIDPKRIELNLYQDMPHLIYPVVTDPQEANKALRWAVAEMELRYKLLAEKGVRNIEAYNRKIAKELMEKPISPPKPAPKPTPEDEEDSEEAAAPEAAPPPPPEPLPYLVIIIDELADLMMVSAKEVEASITRLAQMARAAGIHLILATQRPSVDVLTGVIKANMPTRISFQVSSKIDSRTILDAGGAEKLLGMGDMLYLPPGTGKIRRIHGAYVSEAEIKRVTDFIKAQAQPNYLEDLVVEAGEGEGGELEGGYDEKYDEAVELVTRQGKASISLIQRHLRIGYNRAARIIEIMEREGVVGPADGARPRQVLAREL